jgi:hypothetical protein
MNTDQVMLQETACSLKLRQVSSGLGTTAHVHHQVDKRCKSRNSIDLCRCSGEGCFHAGDGGFCQGRHDE